MNYIIEGKARIEQFLSIIKAFKHPLLFSSGEKMIFLESEDYSNFNEVKKMSSPAYYAQFNESFFFECQTKIRENHLKFEQINCQYIQLQQELFSLNSHLENIQCEIRGMDLIYKALKPIVTSRIKQLKLSFCYLLMNSNNQIKLYMIITAISEIGIFTIHQPLIQIEQQYSIEYPQLQYKILTLRSDSCKTILTQIQSNILQISCDVDNFDISTGIGQSESIKIKTISLPYYNSAFVEELFGMLKIQQIYDKSYKQIFTYSNKSLQDCSIYISECNKQDNLTLTNLYLVTSDNHSMFCTKQTVYIGDIDNYQQGLGLEISEDFLDEIDQQQSGNISENIQFQSQTHQISLHNQKDISQISNQNYQQSIKENQKNQKDDEEQLIIPNKVSQTLDEAILEYYSRNYMNSSTINHKNTK